MHLTKRLSTVAVVLQISLAGSLCAQSATTLAVSAHMDVYQAGGYSDGSGGVPPATYTFSAAPGQTITFPSVTGTWTCSGGVPEYGPDGTTNGPCNNIGFQYIENPIGPFSGYALTDFVGALAGVFLEDSLPASAPPSYRFYVANSSDGGIQIDFRALSPQIGQVFFIGDGLTGTGTGDVQIFAVPPTATHLYLGYVDWCGTTEPYPGCYSDNAGSLTATLRLKQVEWIQPHLSVSPPGRCCMGMAYDEAMHATLLFGGFTNPTFLNDTWMWRHGWTQMFPATAPSPRQGPGMAYDAAAGNVVLFGGTDASGAFLNDTWTWDGTTWTQQFPPLSPPPRRFDTQGMAYDATTRTVVFFGGLAGNNSFLGDTWTWDGLAKTWTQHLPASSPSPRRTTIAYDDATQTVVLFGGENASTAYNDTWTWNGITWTQQFPASAPSPRGMESMAFDGDLGSVVLFGGVDGPGSQSNETWLWNGTNWYQIHPARAPAGRWAAGTDYDPIAQTVLLFGGFGTTTLSDTWLFVWAP